MGVSLNFAQKSPNFLNHNLQASCDDNTLLDYDQSFTYAKLNDVSTSGQINSIISWKDDYLFMQTHHIHG